MTQTQPIPFRVRLRANTRDLIAAQMPVFRGRVFASRHVALRADQLPAVRIYTHEDSRQTMTPMHNIGYFQGVVSMAVQVVMQGGADTALDDRLDELCFGIEALLMSSPAWKCGAGEGMDSIATSIDHDDTTQARLSTATITFGIRYADNLPVLIEDDLNALLLAYDFIDPPADPNTTGHPTAPPDGYPGGYPGPDGRIEITQLIDVTED